MGPVESAAIGGVTVYPTAAVRVCPSELVAITVKAKDPAVAVSSTVGDPDPARSTQVAIPGPLGSAQLNEVATL